MARPVLVIGNKNYSSWSLRPWLLLSVKGIAFDEVRVPLYQQQSRAAIQSHAPAGRAQYGKVPILKDGDLSVWDSLAICEYVAERFPALHCWPTDPRDRARARSLSAEMHAGFRALRTQMPMNCRRTPAPVARDAEVDADIARVIEIWTQALADHAAPGPYLFGEFGVADAILALPALQAWIAAARRETEVLEHFQR